MNIIVDKATDVVELKVSRHGIIHGLERFRNRRVKVVVLENVLEPLSETPHSSDVDPDTGSLPSKILGEAHSMGINGYVDDGVATDTLSLIREFVTS